MKKRIIFGISLCFALFNNLDGSVSAGPSNSCENAKCPGTSIPICKLGETPQKTCCGPSCVVRGGGTTFTCMPAPLECIDSKGDCQYAAMTGNCNEGTLKQTCPKGYLPLKEGQICKSHKSHENNSVGK